MSSEPAEAGEYRLSARRTEGDPLGKTDSVAAGVSVSECCMRPARQIADLGIASAVSSRPAEAGELSHGTFHRIIDSGIGLQKNSAGNNRQSLRLLFMLVSYRFSGWYFAVLPAVHDI